MREHAIRSRAEAIACAGGVNAALASGALEARADVSLSEGLVIGLLKQGVRKFFGILGHGNTDIGEILRIYSQQGALRFLQCRNEVAMAHAATLLAWGYGETPAVLSSIGPGSLQAYAGSLVAASNRIGVYHVYGDETTHGEGYNMQQVPGSRQGEFGRLTDIIGRSYVLHTPEALRDALRRGTLTVHKPYSAGPFYLCLPINTQPKIIRRLNLESLPDRLSLPKSAPIEGAIYRQAAALLLSSARIVLKAGGGSRRSADAVRRLAERVGAAVILSPNSIGILPDRHPQNLHVGGSKGSISGNFAMEEAELLIVVGSRAVCQADCSGTGYPKVRNVININGDWADATHYNRTTALAGDVTAVIDRLLDALGNAARDGDLAAASARWLAACAARKAEWIALRAERTAALPLYDEAWRAAVLGQPAAVATVARFAREIGALKIFDAGDVQANGFQISEDSDPFDTITESGASYMGFAASSLLAGAAADHPRYMIAFCGDGSFMMNPQILIDAAVHRVRSMVVIFDNRRMGAISSLQSAQFGHSFGTNDEIAVDFVGMANSVAGVRGFHGGRTREEMRRALRAAYEHDGLSVVHVPVYWGGESAGGMGTYGRWNVGPWVADVERLYADQII